MARSGAQGKDYASRGGELSDHHRDSARMSTRNCAPLCTFSNSLYKNDEMVLEPEWICGDQNRGRVSANRDRGGESFILSPL